jgi:hypothetical protein
MVGWAVQMQRSVSNLVWKRILHFYITKVTLTKQQMPVYYSDPIYNANEGLCKVTEILLNCKSRCALGMWVSGTSLVLRKAALVESRYIHNEWLCMGCRSPGLLTCLSCSGKRRFSRSRPYQFRNSDGARCFYIEGDCDA